MAGMKKRLCVRVGRRSERDRNGFRRREIVVFWGFRRKDGLWDKQFYSNGVTIRLQSDDDRSDYGPHLEFEPGLENAKIATRICKVLRWDTTIPALLRGLKALEVASTDESYIYREEPWVEGHPLMALARQAI